MFRGLFIDAPPVKAARPPMIPRTALALSWTAAADRFFGRVKASVSVPRAVAATVAEDPTSGRFVRLARRVAGRGTRRDVVGSCRINQKKKKLPSRTCVSRRRCGEKSALHRSTGVRYPIF